MRTLELISRTIAVVYDPVPPPAEPMEQVFRALMRPPLNVTQGLDGSLMVSSSRDQIEVSLLPNKIDVRDVSGDEGKTPGTVPNIVKSLLDSLAVEKIATYGVNLLMDLSFDDHERPDAWIARTFLNQSRLAELGPSLSSDNVSVSFDQDSKRQTIRFQVIEGQRIRVNSNASSTTNSLPPVNQLEMELTSGFEGLTEFLRKVGLD